MCFGGGGGGGNAAAEAAAAQRRAEQERQERISAGADSINSTFDSNFNSGFYDGIRNAATEYYQPVFDDQQANARRELALLLANSGLLQSSVAARRHAALNQKIQQGQLDIAQRADGYVNKHRSNIENARHRALSQNAAVGDPAAAAAGAQSQLAALSKMPTFDPLGNIFEGVTDGLLSAREQYDRRQAGGTSGLFNTSSSSDSGRLIG